MTSTLVFTAALAVLLITVLPQALGIQCYHCNSKVDPGCAELSSRAAEGNATKGLAAQKYLKTCEDGPDGSPPFCRKSFINVLNANEGNGDERFVRACGWVRYKYPCYKFDDDDHHETVCQCFEDGCNAAPHTAASVALALAPAAALALALARR